MIGHFALTLTRFKEKCMLKKYAFSNRYPTSVSGLWEPITGSFTIACFANTYCQYGKHILLIFISSWTYCCILNVTAQFITRQLKWPWRSYSICRSETIVLSTSALLKGKLRKCQQPQVTCCILYIRVFG